MTYFKKTLKLLKFLILSHLLLSPPLFALKTIGITQIVDHPSLNAIREGVEEGLAEAGFVEGKEIHIIYENAQGNPTVAAQIAQKFSSLPLNVVVPITTPSAQAIVQQIKDVPIVFAAISDPIAAKVVTSLEKPGGNVTGVADIPPLAEQLDFMQQCLPNLRVIGVVYNPGESNNVSFLEKLQELADKRHIKVLTVAAPKSSDVRAAALSLVGQVDAIFVGLDNTVVSGLEALVKACLDAKKPLFVSDPESVERGALAAYSYNQKDLGKQVGRMVAEVLNGKNPGDMPVEKPKDFKPTINSQTAEKLNVTCAITAPLGRNKE
jgi:putative ABC transport system substrate-binding protein